MRETYIGERDEREMRERELCEERELGDEREVI